MQGFINDMIGNSNFHTMVHNSNKATHTEQDEINDLNEDLRHLRYELNNNINDNDIENSHDKTILVNNRFNPTTPLMPSLWKKRKDGFMNGMTRMMSETIDITLLQKRMNQVAHTRLRVITTSLKRLQVITTSINSPKPSITGY